MLSTDRYNRSSRCSGGNCVEVKREGRNALVRDSKDLSIEPVPFTETEWTQFVDGIKLGDFADL